MFTFAIISGLIILMATNRPEPIAPQINKTSAPAAIGASKNISGNMTIGAPTSSPTPRNTDTFSTRGIISSLVFVTQNPNNTISDGNSAAGIKDAKKFVLAGDCVLTVNNGKVTGFTAKFKVLNNGQK